VSALEPGLYRATVRGVADQIVMVNDEGNGFTINKIGVCGGHVPSLITDARPLIVLDLSDPAKTVQRLRAVTTKWSYADDIADQIEAQTQVRPSEPSDPAVRVKVGGNEWAKIGPWWVCADMGEVPRQWDYLADLGDDQ
jgi:hypothetical protein